MTTLERRQRRHRKPLCRDGCAGTELSHENVRKIFGSEIRKRGCLFADRKKKTGNGLSLNK